MAFWAGLQRLWAILLHTFEVQARSLAKLEEPPKDHISIRISHSSSEAQYGEGYKKSWIFVGSLIMSLYHVLCNIHVYIHMYHVR